MDSQQFRSAAHQMTDYIIDYLDNIRNRRVTPELPPGYLRPLLPSQAPEKPDKWGDILKDVENLIMPGVTHWHHPNFHAYYPSGNTYPSILGDMLCDAIGCIGFTWMASPACTELEVIMMDWLGQLLGLPESFLARSNGPGGGVIQGTASESVLVSLLAARTRSLRHHKENFPCKDPFPVKSLVAYCSDQAHISVERAGMMGAVTVRKLTTDENLSLRGATLCQAIEEDIANGLVPFFVVGTIGATPACSTDNIRELGEVCNENGLWLHIDAAYAGAAFVCEEYRDLMDGVELADSFNFNPHKWLLVSFDCSAMWVKDAADVINAFNLDPIYLKYEREGQQPDYRHWQIPLGRRFRSLKLWFVMRLYGSEGLQAHIRKQVSLAHEFESYVKEDLRFEIVAPVTLGLVCFRIKGDEELTKSLLKKLNDEGVVHLVPGAFRNIYYLRLAVCSRFTESEDIKKSWNEIKKQTDSVLSEKK
ncbi:hypothetical protein SK128_006333 [Halocaridina rubra]|uniref:Aromatic-L-amino-acid decarboxylase n=1 Tax=Halocaridina rubra TaxID=373956 RepID=A0AAN8WJ70_HALRR